MRAYDDASWLVEGVWERLRARVAGYPQELRELSEAWFAQVDGQGYFGAPDAAPLLFLPLWADPEGDRDAHIALGEATALAYFHVRVQDNVIDEPGGRADPPLLLAANAWLWDALRVWSDVPHAGFQVAARDAWLRFSAATEAERRQLGRLGAYPEALFRAHAGKVALAEIPVLAVLARTGRWDLAAQVRPLVHALGVAYGRMNDVAGHARDLRAGMATHLLSKVRVSLPADAGDDDVLRAIATAPWLEDALSQAAEDHAAALPHAAALGMMAFVGYHEERVARLRAWQTRISLLRLASALTPVATSSGTA